MTSDPTRAIDAALEAIGVPAREPVDAPASTSRFPDGVAFRIEIPSVEESRLSRCRARGGRRAGRSGAPVVTGAACRC